ncbi:MAG: hypothetical protein WC862_04775 [Patescibacteria group bacterium]
MVQNNQLDKKISPQSEPQKKESLEPNIYQPPAAPEVISPAQKKESLEPNISQPPAAPEVSIGYSPEREIIKTEGEGFLDETIQSMKRKLKRPPKKKSIHLPQIRDELTVKVEKIMEEGLKEAFQELPVIQQQEFKMKGEDTALKIRILLRAAHLKVKKIFRLLLEWLKMLPGINRFYLEQEAKIKTDKIVTLKHLDNNPKL